MSYSNLLKRFIKDAGMSYSDIVKGCQKLGTSIDKSYISKLVNNVIASPSVELLQTLEKVLKLETNILVIESYFDSSPEPIKEFTNNLRERLVELKVNSNDDINEVQKKIQTDKYYSFPMIKILEFFKSAEYFESSHFINIDTLEENSSIELTITNDGLAPLIPNGSKIQVMNLESYNEGDLVSAVINENGATAVGKYYTLSKTKVMLVGTNLNYDPIIINKKYFSIIGKVVSYTATL